MRRFSIYLSVLGFYLALGAPASAQINVGRFQLVSVSAGQQAGVFLIDTASGCTWELASNAETKRLTFVEMDVENLHWSWGSGAQQKLAGKIDESKLPNEQKLVLKEELNKTACGWTPVVLTPGPGGSAPSRSGAPASKK